MDEDEQQDPQQSQGAPTADDVFGFLQGVIGTVVSGVGSVVGASGNQVTTADGGTYQATPQNQGGETVIIFEDRSTPATNNNLLTYGLLGVAALLLLRR